MAISFVSSQTATATTLTLPTHSTGDLLLMFAYRTTTTAPTVPSGWTSITTGSGDSNACAVAYRFATGSDTVGTWTSATQLICQVYRGVKAVGAHGTAKDTTTSPGSIPTLTLQQIDGTSWVVGFIGSKQGTSQSTPGTLANRAELKNSSTSMVDGYDTNGGVSSFSAASVTLGSSTDTFAVSVELIQSVASPSNLVNSTIIKGGTTIGTLPWNPTVGNLLLVGMTYNSTTGPTAPTDNQIGNTYTLADSADDTGGGNTAALYYCVVAASSGSFIITATEPVGGDFFVAEYSGMTASPLDQVNSATGSSTQPIITVTPGQSNELVVLVEFDEGTGSSLPPQWVWSPFAQEGVDPSNSADERLVYADYTAPNTSLITAKMSGYGGSWAAVIATFKASGGTLHTQSLSGGLSFSGTLTKSTNKNMAAGLSFSGALNRAISKNMTSGLSFAGSLVKALTKSAFTAVLSFTGTFSKIIVHNVVLSGALSFAGSLKRSVAKSMSAGLSFTGSLAKSISKKMTAGLSFTGSLIKLTAKQLNANLTFAGVLFKQAQKRFAGGLSFTGTFAKRIVKSLTGNLSFTGALSKGIVKFMSGGLSFTGTLVRAISHHFTAALSFTGTLTGVESGGTLYMQALSGALSFTGNLQRQTQKHLTGTLSFVGSFNKLTMKHLTAALSFVGSFKHTMHKSLVGGLNFTGTLGRSIAKSFGSSLSFTGTLVAAVIEGMAGVLAIAENTNIVFQKKLLFITFQSKSVTTNFQSKNVNVEFPDEGEDMTFQNDDSSLSL